MPLYEQLNKNTSPTGMEECGVNMSSPPIVPQSINSPMMDHRKAVTEETVGGCRIKNQQWDMQRGAELMD